MEGSCVKNKAIFRLAKYNDMLRAGIICKVLSVIQAYSSYVYYTVLTNTLQHFSCTVKNVSSYYKSRVHLTYIAYMYRESRLYRTWRLITSMDKEV